MYTGIKLGFCCLVCTEPGVSLLQACHWAIVPLGFITIVVYTFVMCRFTLSNQDGPSRPVGHYYLLRSEELSPLIPSDSMQVSSHAPIRSISCASRDVPFGDVPTDRPVSALGASSPLLSAGTAINYAAWVGIFSVLWHTSDTVTHSCHDIFLMRVSVSRFESHRTGVEEREDCSPIFVWQSRMRSAVWLADDLVSMFCHLCRHRNNNDINVSTKYDCLLKVSKKGP